MPDISKAGLLPERFEHDWKPIMKRVRFVYMEESFTGKVFGYDAKTLAHCIRGLLPAEDLPEPAAAIVAPQKH